MAYEPKNFDGLVGTEGFSEQLLKNHFALYQGYVANTNKLNDLLIKLEKEDKFNTPEYSELNRRFGWEFNGMRLHEHYFSNLVKDARESNRNSEFVRAVSREWGSFEIFEKDFKSMGLMRGIGWVVLYYDRPAERLFNIWVNEHDAGHLAGAAPLLVMDVFEHAYMQDYGFKKADYIETFFKAIDWQKVAERFSQTD